MKSENHFFYDALVVFSLMTRLIHKLVYTLHMEYEESYLHYVCCVGIDYNACDRTNS